MVVSKGVLKAKMLEYFRKVEETKEELIVTNNNVPVLKVIPIQCDQAKSWAEIFSKSNRITYKSIEDLISSEDQEWGDYTF